MNDQRPGVYDIAALHESVPSFARPPTLPRAFFVGSQAYDEWAEKEGSEPNKAFVQRMRELDNTDHHTTIEEKIPMEPIKTAAQLARQPGIAQQAAARAAVSYHPTIHFDPFSAPRMYTFEVAGSHCSLVIRNWRDNPSYDPNALDLPDGVALDEVRPGWEEVNYDTLRELIFTAADGIQSTSVRFRLDW